MGRRERTFTPDTTITPLCYVIGIDPGQLGGVALLAEDMSHAEAVRCPGKGDYVAMAQHIKQLLIEYPGDIALAVVEQVGARPARNKEGKVVQGIASTFKFGKGVGVWLGILAAYEIPVIEVTPQKWQAKLLESRSLKNKGINTKELSLRVARARYTQVEMPFKADDGKADALHLARWGVLWRKGEVE